MSIIGGVNLGNLTNFLFMFANGSVDANWQGATKGFIGDVAVDGIKASERTSGSVPYAGTIFTNDATLGAWQNIINQNVGQATGSTGQVALISSLEADLVSAIQQINALPATPGFESVSATSLNGLNTQNGINEVFVINITSGLNFSSKINITGDPGDVFILRWDTDGNPANGYQGQVKPQSGGAIVPLGGLKPSNFINVAGDINSSGGGSNPALPYPQGPRHNNGTGALITGGTDWSGGGFFTGYWLTTGAPTNFDSGTGLFFGETQSLSNGIFVGGWYTITTKFSMTSGTSGVYVSPNAATFPTISVKKEVSNDNGATWFDANTAPGPSVLAPTNPQFRFTVTNTGNVTLTNVQVTDDVLGPIASLASLAPGASDQTIVVGVWAAGQHVNTATATGTFDGLTVTASDPAFWFGVTVATPAIQVIKEVSPDGGVTWFDANTPPGPNVPEGVMPQFRFTVINTGNIALANVQVTDDVLGPIGTVADLAPGAFAQWIFTGTWALGQQVNTATATGTGGGQTVTSTDPAFWVGTAVPVINVKKEVSPDNGATWFDANEPTGPDVMFGTNPRFRFTVLNPGSVTLTDVVVTDDVFGMIGTVAVLAPGGTSQWIVIGTWVAGQQVNIATATGTGDGQTVSANDPAFWFGVGGPAPSITVLKEVSPDNGITWFDANTPPGPNVVIGTNPQFRFTVTNTGNVALTNVTVTDNVLGPNPIIGPIASLAPGASQQVIVIGTWALGQHSNTATATGTSDGQTLTETDPAFWVGVEAPTPGITVIKEVSPNNGITWFDANTPPGPNVVMGTNPQFRFTVTNTGNVALTNVTVTDNVLGPNPIIGPIASLAPGASQQVIVIGTWAPGQQSNTATATGTSDGQTLTATDPAFWFGANPQITIEKLVSVDNGVTFVDADTPPGPLLPAGITPQFKIIITNTGNETLTNITVTDSVFGVIGTLPSLAVGASQVFIIT